MKRLVRIYLEAIKLVLKGEVAGVSCLERIWQRRRAVKLLGLHCGEAQGGAGPLLHPPHPRVRRPDHGSRTEGALPLVLFQKNERSLNL